MASSNRIAECLVSERSDLDVSEWLQTRSASLAREVEVAALANEFLMGVNCDGLASWFGNDPEAVVASHAALVEIGCGAIADRVQAAVEQLGISWPPDAQELANAVEDCGEKESDLIDQLTDQVIAQSAMIEEATHRYIQAHLAVFERFDDR